MGSWKDARSDHPPTPGAARKAIHSYRWHGDPLDHRSRGAGLPYLVYPRLILVWMTTEALRTGERRLELGRSLSSFMGNSACSGSVVIGERCRGFEDKWNVSSARRSPHGGGRTKAGRATLAVTICCWRRSLISGGLRKGYRRGRLGSRASRFRRNSLNSLSRLQSHSI